MVNKSNSAASHFGAKADTYKSEAVTQLEIAKELAQYIENSSNSLDGTWLDIGSGPAILSSLFYSKHPQTHPILLDISEESLCRIDDPNNFRICSDMDAMPFFPNSIDNIVASSSFQ